MCEAFRCDPLQDQFSAAATYLLHGLPAAFNLPHLWRGQPASTPGTLARAHCKEMKISLNSLIEF